MGNNNMKPDNMRNFMRASLDVIKEAYPLNKKQLNSIHSDGYNLRKELNKSHREKKYFPLLPSTEDKDIIKEISNQGYSNFLGVDQDVQSDEDFDENNALEQVNEIISEEDNKSN